MRNIISDKELFVKPNVSHRELIENAMNENVSDKEIFIDKVFPM